VEGSSKQPVFLIVVKGHTIKNRRGERVRYRPPGYLLVNAVKQAGRWVMPADAVEILTWAWQRWEGEVCHREVKTGFGVGELQCWSERASILSVQWAVWMYAVLMLAGYRAWGLSGHCRSPLGRWRTGCCRWSLNTLWQAYRQELWQPPEFRATCQGSPSEWSENPPFRAALWNVVRGCVRG
jgi:hypothetical protein